MKYTYPSLLAVLCFVFSHCSKERGTTSVTSIEKSFTDSSLFFLQQTLNYQDYGNLDLSSTRVLKDGNRPIAFHIVEKNSHDQKFILLYKVVNTFYGNKADVSGIKASGNKTYSGKIVLKTLKGAPLRTLEVENNRAVTATDGDGIVEVFRPTKSLRINDTISARTLDEVYIYGSNPSNPPDYASMYWLFNQYSGYENVYYNDYYGVNGSESSTKDSIVNQVSIAPEYKSPDHPIKNIFQELRCFTVNSQSTYSVAINVNEPNPTTRDLTNVSAEHQAGHVFLTMKEQFPDGTIMIRNVGFYPMNYSKPGSGVDKSVFGDDSETSYTVSLNISLTASEFATFRNAVYEQQDKTYILEGFNCVNSVMTSFNSINVALPSTIGKNALFIGNNPADLGEDIRGMDINKFSAENGGKKMVRTVSNQNDIIATVRQGGC